MLDLFDLLASDPRCRILTESDAYQYSRIGRKSVTKDLMLTVGEAEEVKALAEEVSKLADARLIAPIKEAVEKITKANSPPCARQAASIRLNERRVKRKSTEGSFKTTGIQIVNDNQYQLR
mgnify:CR=1 FL=1